MSSFMLYMWCCSRLRFDMLDSYLQIFFCFKQKTAYEMRISDWSSDVCSSDLGDQRRVARRDAELAHLAGGDDHFRLTVEDLVLGADDVATDCGHVSLASLV